MVRQAYLVSYWFWNFVGFGLMWLLIGSGYSVARAKVYQLELAQYKLEVGTSLNKVQQVSNTLGEATKILPLPQGKKQKIFMQLEESNAVIEQTEQKVERDIKDLIEVEEPKK